MSIDALTDLHLMDRDLRAAATRLASFRASLADDDGRQTAARRDPFDGLRHVAVKKTYEALAAGTRLAEPAFLREAAGRWVHELLQARVALDLYVAEAEALAATTAPEELARRAGRAALSTDPATSTPEGERPALFVAEASTFDEALFAAFAKDEEGALERATRLAPRVGAVRREARARRFEAARLLGLPHPSALVTPGDPSGEALAQAVLEATEPVASSLHRAARKTERPRSPVASALARDAREGWPAQLTTRAMSEMFAGLEMRAPREVTMPEVVGGASFLLGAARWGASVRTLGVARSLPFALARDPYAPEVHLFGGLFAWALADPIMQKRALGVGARAVSSQARALRTSLLVALRWQAARVVLARAPGATRDGFEELTSRVFGAPLPDGLRDAWPRLREDDVARLAASVKVSSFAAEMVARYDEDWYRNPKAGAHLAGMASRPAYASFEVIPLVGALARVFEEAVG